MSRSPTGNPHALGLLDLEREPPRERDAARPDADEGEPLDAPAASTTSRAMRAIDARHPGGIHQPELAVGAVALRPSSEPAGHYTGGLRRRQRARGDRERARRPPRPATIRAVNVSDFDFDLPPEAIAQRPAPRGTSRLMTLDRATGAVAHRSVADLPSLLRAGRPPRRQRHARRPRPPLRGRRRRAAHRVPPRREDGATRRPGTASRSRDGARSRAGPSTSAPGSGAPSPGRESRGTTASPSRGRRSRRPCRASGRRRSPRTSTARAASPTRATPRTTRPSTRASRARSPRRRPAST